MYISLSGLLIGCGEKTSKCGIFKGKFEGKSQISWGNSWENLAGKQVELRSFDDIFNERRRQFCQFFWESDALNVLWPLLSFLQH